MADAQIRFEKEDQEGIIPVGSYVGDALRRFGIKGFDRCTAEHDCVVTIMGGRDLLSGPTALEIEQLGEEERKSGERLACHARIEKPGEIVVMTKERKEEPESPEDKGEQYRKEFSDLPLDRKITELMKLEAIALGETFSFIANSPYKVFEKIGDVMADFGLNLENKARDAQRPEEHNDKKPKSHYKHKKGEKGVEKETKAEQQ
jgi:ferredoxin